METIVIDTNVLVAAFKSKRGASNKLLQFLGTKKFSQAISVTLFLEYEAVLKRLFPEMKPNIDHFLDYFCSCSKITKVHYLWRPQLKDPSDDMVLEVSVVASANFIVTYNLRDFANIQNFKIKAVTPKEFLLLIGELL